MASSRPSSPVLHAPRVGRPAATRPAAIIPGASRRHASTRTARVSSPVHVSPPARTSAIPKQQGGRAPLTLDPPVATMMTRPRSAAEAADSNNRAISQVFETAAPQASSADDLDAASASIDPNDGRIVEQNGGLEQAAVSVSSSSTDSYAPSASGEDDETSISSVDAREQSEGPDFDFPRASFSNDGSDGEFDSTAPFTTTPGSPSANSGRMINLTTAFLRVSPPLVSRPPLGPPIRRTDPTHDNMPHYRTIPPVTGETPIVPNRSPSPSNYLQERIATPEVAGSPSDSGNSSSDHRSRRPQVATDQELYDQGTVRDAVLRARRRQDGATWREKEQRQDRVDSGQFDDEDLQIATRARMEQSLIQITAPSPNLGASLGNVGEWERRVSFSPRVQVLESEGQANVQASGNPPESFAVLGAGEGTFARRSPVGTPVLTAMQSTTFTRDVLAEAPFNVSPMRSPVSSPMAATFSGLPLEYLAYPRGRYLPARNGPEATASVAKRYEGGSGDVRDGPDYSGQLLRAPPASTPQARESAPSVFGPGRTSPTSSGRSPRGRAVSPPLLESPGRGRDTDPAPAVPERTASPTRAPRQTYPPRPASPTRGRRDRPLLTVPPQFARLNGSVLTMASTVRPREQPDSSATALLAQTLQFHRHFSDGIIGLRSLTEMLVAPRVPPDVIRAAKEASKLHSLLEHQHHPLSFPARLPPEERALLSGCGLSPYVAVLVAPVLYIGISAVSMIQNPTNGRVRGATSRSREDWMFSYFVGDRPVEEPWRRHDASSGGFPRVMPTQLARRALEVPPVATFARATSAAAHLVATPIMLAADWAALALCLATSLVFTVRRRRARAAAAGSSAALAGHQPARSPRNVKELQGLSPSASVVDTLLTLYPADATVPFAEGLHELYQHWSRPRKPGQTSQGGAAGMSAATAHAQIIASRGSRACGPPMPPGVLSGLVGEYLLVFFLACFLLSDECGGLENESATTTWNPSESNASGDRGRAAYEMDGGGTPLDDAPDFGHAAYANGGTQRNVSPARTSPRVTASQTWNWKGIPVNRLARAVSAAQVP